MANNFFAFCPPTNQRQKNTRRRRIRLSDSLGLLLGVAVTTVTVQRDAR